MKPKICFVVAVPGTAISFLRDHIKSLSEFFDVYLAGNIKSDDEVKELELKGWHHIDIERQISIKNDLKAVAQLTRYFKSMKFEAVHSVTPKAGLITAIAAKLAGVKQRIHIFTGQVWATQSGAMRFLLKSLDKVIARLDNHILTDGESQRQFLIGEGVVGDSKSRVLGAGSICGANTVRFNPSDSERKKQRAALNLTDEKVVFTFMGRLNSEKGLYELLAAFNGIVQECPNAFLLLFGSDEGGIQNLFKNYPNIKEGKNFRYCGATATPQLSLQAGDVFCLPSYREGFGMSVVEASCLGLPVICSDAYGLADTMVDNETGLRCQVKDVESLRKAMIYMYDHPEERKRMGGNGRERVLELFAGEKIVAEWVKFYREILPN